MGRGGPFFPRWVLYSEVPNQPPSDRLATNVRSNFGSGDAMLQRRELPLPVRGRDGSCQVERVAFFEYGSGARCWDMRGVVRVLWPRVASLDLQSIISHQQNRWRVAAATFGFERDEAFFPAA